jgi:hypothetical protein
MASHLQKEITAKELVLLIPVKTGIAGRNENHHHEADLTKDLHARDTGPGIQVNRAMALHLQKDITTKERALLIPVKTGTADQIENPHREAGLTKDLHVRDTGPGIQANNPVRVDHQEDTAAKELILLIPVKTGTAGKIENIHHGTGLMKDLHARWVKVLIPQERQIIPVNRSPALVMGKVCVLINT